MSYLIQLKQSNDDSDSFFYVIAKSSNFYPTPSEPEIVNLYNWNWLLERNNDKTVKRFTSFDVAYQYIRNNSPNAMVIYSGVDYDHF